MTDIARPRLEGTVAVRDDRRLSFAEFGTPRGAAVIWMHGTPGGRRQVPIEARMFAEEHDVRIIGIDRPGIGTSTPHLYDNVLDWTGDLEVLADNLGVDTFRVIGLSGGGPYALAAGAALPDRVHGVGVLGGVAPTTGPDAIRGRTGRGRAVRRPDRRRRPGCRWLRPRRWHPAGQAVGQPRDRRVRRGAAARRQGAARPPRVQGDVPRRPDQRRTVPGRCPAGRHHPVHPALGVRCRGRVTCRCVGGTATRTTSSRTPTACTWSSGCRTPKFATIDGESPPGRHGRGHRGAADADGARAAEAGAQGRAATRKG